MPSPRLVYASWLVVTERARIDDAIEIAERRMVPFENRPGSRVFVIGLRWPSEIDAIEAIIEVCAEVVAVLQHIRTPVPLAKKQLEAERLLAQLIMWGAGGKSAATTLTLFETRVRAAVEVSAWWQAFMQPASSTDTPVGTPTPVADDTLDELLSLKAAAELLDRDPRTLQAMERRGEMTLIRVGNAIKVRLSEVKRVRANRNLRS